MLLAKCGKKVCSSEFNTCKETGAAQEARF